MPSPLRFRFIGLLLVWMTVVFTAQAHDPGLSAVALRLESRELHVDLSMALDDVRLLVQTLESDSAGRISQPTLAAATPQLQRLARDAFEVEWNGHQVSPTGFKIQADDSRAIHFRMNFPREAATTLAVRSTLISKLGRGHRQYLALHGSRGELLAEQMLDATRDTFSLACESAAPAASKSPSFRQFLTLGVGHILSGYDHLCFLLGLLIAGGSLREVLKIITAFTVAHSITLALATMNVLNIPPRIIEPLIAVSIVYVGIENILRRDLRRRWLLSFGFGLVHGCGFASALRELGIGSDGSGIVVPLVGFNLGVECGQVAIAALVLPLIWKLKNRPAFALRYAPACSLMVSLAGGYWLVQRICQG